jgi:hypothetical protein
MLPGSEADNPPEKILRNTLVHNARREFRIPGGQKGSGFPIEVLY